MIPAEDVVRPDLCQEISLQAIEHPKHAKLGNASYKLRERLKSIKSLVSSLRANSTVDSSVQISALLEEAKKCDEKIRKLKKEASKRRFDSYLLIFIANFRFTRSNLKEPKRAYRGRPPSHPHQTVLSAMDEVVHRQLTAAHERRRDTSVSSTMSLVDLTRETEQDLRVPISNYVVYTHTKPRNKRMM